MPNTPTIEPISFRAGDTIKWTKSLADYPASAGWALKYKFVGDKGAPAVIAAAASGDDFSVTITATTTAAYVAGIYTLQGWVEKAGEQYTISVTTVEILANLSISSATDTRSNARKQLVLIETAIESYSVRPVESVSAFGRTWTRPSLRTLYNLRSRYLREIRKEEDAQRIAQGKKPRRIVSRFGTPS